MKIRIHFEVNGHEDSIDLQGSLEDIKKEWASYSEGKPISDPWSEVLEEDQALALDANREMLGDDADYLEAADIDNVGCK